MSVEGEDVIEKGCGFVGNGGPVQWCREVVSLAQGLNSVLSKSRAETPHRFEEGLEGRTGAWEKRVSVLWVFNLSVQVVKHLSKVISASLSMRDVVSGRQD